MQNPVRYFLFAAVMVLAAPAWAQKPKTPAAKTDGFQKFAPPKDLKTMLGIRTDTTVVYREEAIQLVKLPLKITDDKKNVYSISSYRVLYKRKAATEDEQTGKVTPVTSDVTDIFRETPLPDLWIKILSTQILPGEELQFFDIVVKDAQGRMMFAPNLVIKVK